MSQPVKNDLLTALLKQVSRLFYLTLRMLPVVVRPQVSLAYLLARTSDTIADTEMVAVESRLQALEALRQRIMGTSQTKLDFGPLAQNQGLPAERVLLERVEEALTVLAGFAEADQRLIREVLETIISGQELDLKRFGAKGKEIIALETDAELDDYTYRVAGCVGEFWTKICLAHLSTIPKYEEKFLLRNGVRFGKGLQMVNILRDLPRDLRNGRCYLPITELTTIGLKPSDLLDPANEPKLRPLYNRYLEKAEELLGSGWDYTNVLPRKEMRLRLACAWPILSGARTLRNLRKGHVLDGNIRIKASRAEVWSILIRTVIFYPLVRRWKGLFWKELKGIK